jgi:hypothetical protein
MDHLSLAECGFGQLVKQFEIRVKSVMEHKTMLEKVKEMNDIVDCIGKSTFWHHQNPFLVDNLLSSQVIQVIQNDCGASTSAIRRLEKLARSFHYNLNIDFIHKKLDKSIYRTNKVWDKFYELGYLDLVMALKYLAFASENDVTRDMLLILEALEKEKTE